MISRNRGIWISTIFFALLVLLSSWAMAQSGAAEDLITPKEAHKLLTGNNPPLLVDVRTKTEFESGHLHNALNVPLDEFTRGAYAEKIGEPAKDEPVLVFCRSGRRSGIVHGILVRDGYTNVKDVKGGIIAWKEAELPILREIESSADETAETDTPARDN
jgi:rhodanese-related sulfurtransferase